MNSRPQVNSAMLCLQAGAMGHREPSWKRPAAMGLHGETTRCQGGARDMAMSPPFPSSRTIMSVSACLGLTEDTDSPPGNGSLAGQTVV